MILVQSNFPFPENERIRFINTEQTKKGKGVRSSSRTPPDVDKISGNASSVSSFMSSHKELTELLAPQIGSSKLNRASNNWRQSLVTRGNYGSNIDNIIAKYSGEPIRPANEKRRSKDYPKIREIKDSSPNRSK
jgi:hypothetical protein